MLWTGTSQAGLPEPQYVSKHIYTGPRAGCLRGVYTWEPDMNEALLYASAVHDRARSVPESSDGAFILLLPTPW